MTQKVLWPLILLFIAFVCLFVAFRSSLIFHRKADQPTPDLQTTLRPNAMPSSATETTHSTAPGASRTAPAGPSLNPGAVAGDVDREFFTSDSFRQTGIFQRWQQQGVTDEDMTVALRTMKLRGFEGPSLRDPALVGQFLPARNITPVQLQALDMPAMASAGKPVPFKLAAQFPSPAYSFSSWDIVTDHEMIRVRPVGHRQAGPVASVVVPVELEGLLPGLPAGTYTVRLEGIGTPL